MRKLVPIALIAVGAAGILLGWPWLTRTPEERAAAQLLASGGGYLLRPGIADCPSDAYARLRRGFLKIAPSLREAPQLLTEIDDAAVNALLRGDAAAPRTRLPQDGVIIAACDGERIRLAAVAADGRIAGRAELALFDAAVERAPRLHIVTRPAGVRAFLDGEPVGTTPLLLTNLAPGPRQLRLRDPRFVAVVDRLTLAPGELARLDYTMRRGTGHLAVVSQPAGAAVDVDGKPWPVATPTLVGPLAAGSHRVELRLAGFAPLKAEAEVPTAATAELSLAFTGARIERPGAIWREPKSGMEMIWVPPGCYRRGCGPWTEDCDPDESLGRDVCVAGFWIGRHEVTQSQWRRVMGADPSSARRGDDRPVNQVSWHAARAFAARLGAGFRLPTEAEWEYACRSGGRPEMYAGATLADGHRAGSEYLSAYAWIGRRWEDGPYPVGKKRANGLGVFDMSGNVWEWTDDHFRLRAYADTPPDNPRVVDATAERVVRGGSWFNYARLARCSHRDRFDAGFTNVDLGLRIVREAPASRRKVEVRR